MKRRVIDISGDGAFLRRNRGLLNIAFDAKTEKQPINVAFDEIESVLVHALHAGYSHGALVRLAEDGIPLVFCDPRHHPVAWLWPVGGHHRQSARMQAQLTVTVGLKRRLWAQMAKAKLHAQASALERCGKDGRAISAMAVRVRSGDPDNLEAQAAARYWRILFGTEFRRSSDGGHPNGLLNYGYTVLRASVARYIVGAGLHPTIGLHHKNEFNDFCLADDLMEPFRPVVDQAVVKLMADGITEVTPEAKLALVSVLDAPVECADGYVPVTRAIERLCLSLANSILEKRNLLDLPKTSGGLL